MKSISHLPDHEKQYYIQCDGCDEWVDKRDLGQIGEHWDCGKSNRKIKASWSSSKKIGDSKEFLNDEGKSEIDLN